MDPGAPDRDGCRLPHSSGGGVGSQGRLRRRCASVIKVAPIGNRTARQPVGSRVRRHSRPLKSGGTAEGPAFRPGRTKAGYVFFGPGTRPKRKRRNHREPVSERTKFVLDEDRMPRAFYNIAADLPEPPPPPLHPGTGQPIGPARPRSALPDGADQAGRQHRPRDRDSRSGARRLRALPTVTALPGATAREGARYAGAHLLQVRGRQPVGQPQAEHGDRPGLLRQAGGRDPLRDRDRRRASGAARWPSPARSSGSRSRSTWSAPATTRSRTDAS